MSRAERLWFEGPEDDLPFYDGKPVALAVKGWSLVLAALLVGLLLLAVPTLIGWGLVGQLIAGVVFCGLPLLVLAALVGEHWKLLLRPLGRRAMLQMVLFACLTFAASIVAALVSIRLADATPSAILGLLDGYSRPQIALVLLGVVPQLIGEELLTILPFLAMLTFLYARGTPRKRAVVIAWLASSLLFAALHLPAYHWNLIQCLLVMGSARLILTMAYIRTRNLWVSAGAHVLVDWGAIGAWAVQTGFQ